MNPSLQKFTILLPTYERGDAAVKCLQSILDQLGGDQLQIVVCDNASADGSWEKIHPRFSTCENITILRNPSNIGVQANLIRLFESFTTEYCVLLSDEDRIDLQELQKVEHYLSSNPTVAFISPKMEYDGKVYRGKDSIENITNDEFWISAFYITGLIYKKAAVLQAIQKITTEHLIRDGQLYPLIFITCAIRAAGHKSVWHPANVAKNILTLPSRVNDGYKAGKYYSLVGRAHQVVLFEAFYTEMIAKSDEEEERNWQNLREIWMKGALGHIRGGFLHDYPDDLIFFDQQAATFTGEEVAELLDKVKWLETKRAEATNLAKKNAQLASTTQKKLTRSQSDYLKIRKSIAWKLARPFHSLEKRLRKL